VTTNTPLPYCAYPADEQGRPMVRSSNDEDATRSQFTSYGLPTCFPFAANSQGASFLSSYHYCLSAGCATSAGRDDVWQALLEVGSSLTFPQNLIWFNMITSGEARPDNYETAFNQLVNPICPTFPFAGFGRTTNNNNNNNNGGNNGGRTFFTGGTGSGSTGSFFPGITNPQGGANPFGGTNPLSPQVLSQLLQGGNLPPGFTLPISPPTYNPCPYQASQINIPGLLELHGLFDGCCDQPICFLPRQSLHLPYSGAASYLSLWSGWGDCSQTCNGGTQRRSRTCVGDNCRAGALMEQTNVCNPEPCPFWSPWTNWGDCSATCGGGMRTRTRECIPTSGQCEGESQQSRPCRPGRCPTINWGPWSSCSNTCGRGTRSRSLTCIDGGAYGCPSFQSDVGPCEQFCGRSTLVCNSETCCNEQQCLQRNGRPGHCQPNPSAGRRCTGHFHCLFATNPCPNSPNNTG